MDAAVNLLKPPGMTSHDVVAFVRRITGVKRVGHTGTLDPAAAGVLPICIGQATRLSDFLQAGRKTYVAECVFGYETNTLDNTGTIVRRFENQELTEETLQAYCRQSVGKIQQIPPDFSAIKVGGKKLYDLARRGEAIPEAALKPRDVTIYSFVLKHFFRSEATVLSRAIFQLECSSGTYVRSLLRDLGRALGAGATMTFLVRTASGRFNLGTSCTLEDFAANPQGQGIGLFPLLRDCFGAQWVDDEACRKLAVGQSVVLPLAQETRVSDTPEVRLLLVTNQAESMAALCSLSSDAGQTVAKPDKVFKPSAG